MSYSTAGHNLGQVSTVDVDAITALFTDSVAAYVENEAASQRRTGAARAAGDGGAADVSLNCTSPREQATRLQGDDALSEWEQARRRRAAERGLGDDYFIVPTVVSHPAPDPADLPLDPEIGRIVAIGFKHAPSLQRWLVLNDMARQTGLQGFTFDELEAKLSELGVKGGRVYNRRIIRRGIRVYWDYDPYTDKIFPTGYVKLTERALQYAHDLGLHDLYASGNHPGQRRPMYVSVKGSSADFEAACFAAWCAAHNCPTITRFTLKHLFNRDRRSFWKIEKRAGIRVLPNEAETDDPKLIPLGKDGKRRGDVRDVVGDRGQPAWRYRMANSYQPSTMIRQHPKRGQSRRAAGRFKKWIASIELHTNRQGEGLVDDKPLVKLNPIGRIYCKNDKSARRSHEQGNTGKVYVAHKPGRGIATVWRLVVPVSDDI